MGGTLDLVQRIYLGAKIRDGAIHFDPRLPERLDGLSMQMQVHGSPIRVSLAGSELTVEALADGFNLPVRVGLGGDVRELKAGEACTLTVGERVGFA
jgi:trehalose/maltose hydrolase-like predicted phosphorylase